MTMLNGFLFWFTIRYSVNTWCSWPKYDLNTIVCDWLDGQTEHRHVNLKSSLE